MVGGKCRVTEVCCCGGGEGVEKVGEGRRRRRAEVRDNKALGRVGRCIAAVGDKICTGEELNFVRDVGSWVRLCMHTHKLRGGTIG